MNKTLTLYFAFICEQTEKETSKKLNNFNDLNVKKNNTVISDLPETITPSNKNIYEKILITLFGPQIKNLQINFIPSLCYHINTDKFIEKSTSQFQKLKTFTIENIDLVSQQIKDQNNNLMTNESVPFKFSTRDNQYLLCLDTIFNSFDSLELLKFLSKKYNEKIANDPYDQSLTLYIITNLKILFSDPMNYVFERISPDFNQYDENLVFKELENFLKKFENQTETLVYQTKKVFEDNIYPYIYPHIFFHNIENHHVQNNELFDSGFNFEISNEQTNINVNEELFTEIEIDLSNFSIDLNCRDYNVFYYRDQNYNFSVDIWHIITKLKTYEATMSFFKMLETKYYNGQSHKPHLIIWITICYFIWYKIK